MSTIRTETHSLHAVFEAKKNEDGKFVIVITLDDMPGADESFDYLINAVNSFLDRSVRQFNISKL